MNSSNNCSQEVQSLFFQKGVVVNTDIETDNSINYRVYDLKYLDEMGAIVIRKFSERSILTDSYWHANNVFLSSSSSTDSPDMGLICYKDDFTTGPICNDIEWFENLNTKEERMVSSLETFPNPSNDLIKIKTNELGSFKLTVYDIVGKSKIARDIYMNGNNEITLDISKLEIGSYLVEIKSDDVRLTSRFIKN